MILSDVINYIQNDATNDEVSSISRAIRDRFVSTPVANDELDTALHGLQETLNTDAVFNGDISMVYSLGEGTNLIAIPSLIREFNKSGDHDCIQPTIVSSADDMTQRNNVHWVWDEESPTFVAAKTVQIGQVRRSAAVHRLVPGMVVAFHHRQKKNERHRRNDTKAYELYIDDGEIDMKEVPLAWTELPLPSNLEEER